MGCSIRADSDVGGRVPLTRNFDFKFALLVILCAALAFFFPAMRGSYSAVHGPVTALRSVRERVRLRLVLALAVLHMWGYRLLMSCVSLLRATWGAISLAYDPPHGTSALRC